MVTLTVSPPLTTTSDDVLAGHLGATVHLLDFHPRYRATGRSFCSISIPRPSSGCVWPPVNIKINLTKRFRVTAFRCAEMHWVIYPCWLTKDGAAWREGVERTRLRGGNGEYLRAATAKSPLAVSPREWPCTCLEIKAFSSLLWVFLSRRLSWEASVHPQTSQWQVPPWLHLPQREPGKLRKITQKKYRTERVLPAPASASASVEGSTGGLPEFLLYPQINEASSLCGTWHYLSARGHQWVLQLCPNQAATFSTWLHLTLTHWLHLYTPAPA